MSRRNARNARVQLGTPPGGGVGRSWSDVLLAAYNLAPSFEPTVQGSRSYFMTRTEVTSVPVIQEDISRPTQVGVVLTTVNGNVREFLLGSLSTDSGVLWDTAKLPLAVNAGIDVTAQTALYQQYFVCKPLREICAALVGLLRTDEPDGTSRLTLVLQSSRKCNLSGWNDANRQRAHFAADVPAQNLFDGIIWTSSAQLRAPPQRGLIYSLAAARMGDISTSRLRAAQDMNCNLTTSGASLFKDASSREWPRAVATMRADNGSNYANLPAPGSSAGRAQARVLAAVDLRNDRLQLQGISGRNLTGAMNAAANDARSARRAANAAVPLVSNGISPRVLAQRAREAEAERAEQQRIADAAAAEIERQNRVAQEAAQAQAVAAAAAAQTQAEADRLQQEANSAQSPGEAQRIADRASAAQQLADQQLEERRQLHRERHAAEVAAAEARTVQNTAQENADAAQEVRQEAVAEIRAASRTPSPMAGVDAASAQTIRELLQEDGGGGVRAADRRFTQRLISPLDRFDSYNADVGTPANDPSTPGSSASPAAISPAEAARLTPPAAAAMSADTAASMSVAAAAAISPAAVRAISPEAAVALSPAVAATLAPAAAALTPVAVAAMSPVIAARMSPVEAVATPAASLASMSPAAAEALPAATAAVIPERVVRFMSPAAAAAITRSRNRIFFPEIARESRRPASLSFSAVLSPSGRAATRRASDDALTTRPAMPAEGRASDDAFTSRLAAPASRRVRFAAMPTARLAARPAARPAAMPTARPAAMPTARPAAMPTARPVERSAIGGIAMPRSIPGMRPAARMPAAIPSARASPRMIPTSGGGGGGGGSGVPTPRTTHPRDPRNMVVKLARQTATARFLISAGAGGRPLPTR
jgi:hypothetical protein